ncbi:MAG: DUF790 family protein [Myxococcales bacterium]|nr:DUF790 family protein [Myxococcales bacterium]
MLTSELLRVRNVGTRLVPRWLEARERERLTPVASELLKVLEANVGERREDLEQALVSVAHEPRDRVVVLGLKKLLLDRCEFAPPVGPEPARIRAEVFGLAALARRALGPTEAFDDHALLSEIAAKHGLDAQALRLVLFADLAKNERLTRFQSLAAEALFARYDLALAQGVLLRATLVEIELVGAEPGRVRNLFRAARFHGLMHHVERLDGDGGAGYRIRLDGPMSLFSASQRYGLALALFLPALLACDSWHLSAELLWGKAKRPTAFELAPTDGLAAPGRALSGIAPGLEPFIVAFRKLESSWLVTANEDILAQPGQRAVIPDLLFRHEQTGARVYLEAFGYWSRAAVWQRIETLRRGEFPVRILLALGKHLRVSEEALDEDSAGELYVYRERMQPRAVLARLEATLSSLQAQADDA